VQEMNCGSCHKVHSLVPGQLLDTKADFCMNCHPAIKTRLLARSSHPIMQGTITCLSCHRFVKRQDSRLAYDLGGVCRSCHPEQSGPFQNEHEAINAYAVDGSGCVECHDPHGSENDHLLQQPGNRVCSSCHVEHATRNHGTLWDKVWSNYTCQTCHTQTHGSFVSNRFLDPNLPAKMGGQCFNTGCHSLNR
jgi:DmsE family decaheme c-type cytochrome